MALQLGIREWPGLLGLPLGEQIIEEPGEPDQIPAPALPNEPEQQSIIAGREMEETGGVDVSEGHGGRRAGRHFQAGRCQGPATIHRCAAPCGTTDNRPRAWLRSLTPPRTLKRPPTGLSPSSHEPRPETRLKSQKAFPESLVMHWFNRDQTRHLERPGERRSLFEPETCLQKPL
jgi:hypothetical protein